MPLPSDLETVIVILEGAARLAPEIATGLRDLITAHRPDLTATAPPESQEEAILDVADTQIKGRFPGAK